MAMKVTTAPPAVRARVMAARTQAIVVLALLSLVVSACASGGASSGLKTGPGVNGKTITLGVLSPLSGPFGDSLGVPEARGVEVFFKGINDAGGINGYQVKLIEKDTKYDPQTEVQAYNEINTQVAMIALSLGTAPTFAIKDQATQDHMLVGGATLASSLAREKYLILLATPYRLQVENGFDYVVNKLGIQNPKTAILYQNDDYGQDGLTGYKESVAAYHLQDGGQVPFAATDTDFTAQITQLKASGAKYVWLTSVPSTTAKVFQAAATLNFHPQWLLQSPAFSPKLLAIPGLGALLAKEAWVVSSGATWGDTTKPGMKQMLDDVAKYAPDQKPDAFFSFSYALSKVVYAILKQAIANNDLTRDGLFKAFESLKNVDLGGLLPSVTYGSSPNQRVPARDSIVFALDPTVPTGTKALSDDFTGTAAQASQF